MSILIKEMEMPDNCALCPMWDAGNCLVATEAIICEYNKRPSDCPLIPVPPHYDLIDHNALKIAVMNGDCETRVDFLKHTMDCINKAPVVIPSDMPTYEAEEGV